MLTSSVGTSMFLGSIPFWFHGRLSCGDNSQRKVPRENVAYVYPVSSWLCRAASSYIYQQDHLFISGVFRPPALRDSIHKLLGRVELLVMHGHLCNLIGCDHASCRSDLHESQRIQVSTRYNHTWRYENERCT